MNHVQASEEAGAESGRVKTRLNKESGSKIKVGVKIGGNDFISQKNPSFLKDRQAIFDSIKVYPSVLCLCVCFFFKPM